MDVLLAGLEVDMIFAPCGLNCILFDARVLDYWNY